jgi:hypothetical protein
MGIERQPGTRGEEGFPGRRWRDGESRHGARSYGKSQRRIHDWQEGAG